MLQFAPRGDNADTSLRFSTLALATPDLEHDLADDRRAALESAADTFDPLKLYQHEMERDLAASLLQETFPACDLTLALTENHHKISGEWSVSRKWLAMVNAAPGGDFHAFAATPGEAVQAVIAAQAKATTRTKPECRSIQPASGEAFGVIDPLTINEFRDVVERGHGRSDFLAIDAGGRVTLTKGASWVGPEEAYAIGGYVAEHNAATAAARANPNQAA